MMNEWMKVVLDEIARKKREAREAEKEREKRQREKTNGEKKNDSDD